ncbi:hypothetical protein [Paracoccus sp. S1E-3]|uniref:hypothetical protein n=1 Tax=Paracoccus sp. S1E-3 TaxID=2756130 RepID=UPI0015EE6567|nr:hypothetical protein [Paracoccus sp. S1E-3]MBA4490090.1 hypothetical protein [Paracoccus sp. S1E-3]
MDHPDPSASSRDRAAVARSWRRYFDPQPGDAAELPLPDPEVDLGPFLRDIIPGTAQRPWMGRNRDLAAHFAGIEVEFLGSPRIAHVLACTIVCLRRDAENPVARRIFWRILTEMGPEVAVMLNSRWLTSICDTVVDIAENDLDRAAALMGTLFINTLKIAETERRLYLPARPWPPQTRLRSGGHIYDGVQTIYTVTPGDVAGLLDRIERGLQLDTPLRPVLIELIHRAIEGDNCVNRIISLTGQPKRPLAPAEALAAVKKIMERL